MQPEGFPLLENGYDGAPFIYLDSASTTPKPREVIAAVARYYETLGANVHRGLYPLAEAATEEYERARHRVAALIGAQPARDRVHAQRDRLVQPRRARAAPRARRRGRVPGVGAPLELSAVARRRAARARRSRRGSRAEVVAARRASSASARGSSASRTSRTSRVSSRPSRIGSRRRMRPESPCSSTRRNPSRICRSTCTRSAWTSSGSRATRCSGRTASAFCTCAATGSPSLGSATSAAAWSRCSPTTASSRSRRRFATRPARRTSKASSVSAPPSTTCCGSAWRNVAAHSRALGGAAHRGARELAGRDGARPLGARSHRARDRVAAVAGDAASRTSRVCLADAHSIFVSGGFHCAHVLHHRLQLDGTLRASAHIYNDAGDIEAFVKALHDLDRCADRP